MSRLRDPLRRLNMDEKTILKATQQGMDKAIEYLEKALAISLKTLDPEDPSIAATLSNLGCSLPSSPGAGSSIRAMGEASMTSTMSRVARVV